MATAAPRSWPSRPALLLAVIAGGCGGVDAGAPAGDAVFDDTVVHTVALTLDDADWQALITEGRTDPPPSDWSYYPARLTFDDRALDGDVGIRLKGHISVVLTEGHAFPFKLDFDRYTAGLALDGLKKLNLHSDFNGPTLPPMRDYLSYGAWRAYGVAASRAAFARVTVNGEDLGVYSLVEQVDGGFLSRELGEPRGDLYKPEQVSGSLAYRGDAITDYPDINLKWPDQSDHAALLHALAVLDAGSMSELEGVFDVTGVLTYLAGNAALASWDSYQMTQHNYYLYEATPGRFTLLPWDMNGSQEAQAAVCGNPENGLGPPLSRRLLEDPVHGAEYIDILGDFLDGAGSSQRLIARLDAAAALLGDAISADEVAGLRGDIQAREQALRQLLATLDSCADWQP